MFEFSWDNEKNEWLKKHRDISFEKIVLYIEAGKLISVEENSSKNFPDQKVFVVEIDNYAYLVPFVKDGDTFYLKTVFPSRKATQKYLR